MLSATKREGAASPVETARFDPVPGTVVADKYRVESTLGEGGMGLVVAATHMALDQHVAIKFLLPEAMRNKVAVERFLREAKVAAKVRSEHVARVHDVGTLDGGVPYIVMEHLEGIDLGKLIAREGALPIEESCEIALQACEALTEVHAAGIVHRDLKPSNLFVTRRADGSPAVKLLDFGISKLAAGFEESGEDPALTATATIMGSPSYMSPEQLKSTKEVDHRSDVWSLGAVLYEAVTGKPAFRGQSVPQVCAMIASEDPAAPSTLREGVPVELDRIILRCLDKTPDSRAELVDLARALARLAPERARSSLERIEATLGLSEPRPRALTPSPVEERSRHDLPILPLATSKRGRTQSVWGAKRGDGHPGRNALLFALLAGGVLGVGVYTGRIHVGGLRGQVEGATSAITSAAGAVQSAAVAVSSAVASSLPDVPMPSALPSAIPSAWPSSWPTLQFDDPSASAEAPTPSAPDETTPGMAPAGVASGASSPQHALQPKPHLSKPHHAAKPWHRHH